MRCNLSAVTFAVNQSQKPTKERACRASQGESGQTLRAELDHYSLPVTALRQMCRNKRKKAVIYPHSAKCADTRYQGDQITSGIHGCY